MSIIDQRAELDIGATPGVPMAILSKTNRSIIGIGNITPPIPTTLANVDTTWASLLHAVTEDKNAEQITVTLSVQDIPLPVGVFGVNGLTARVQWGVFGGWHEAFLDIGVGTSFTVHASSLKVDVQNAALNRATLPFTFFNSSPRIVSASLAVGDLSPGPLGGPRRTFLFSGIGAGAVVVTQIPPFAAAFAICAVTPGVGSVRFINDDGLAELGRYNLVANQTPDIFPIPPMARTVSFSYVGAPTNVIITWILKL